MSRFTGPQHPGAAKQARVEKRQQAEARSALAVAAELIDRFAADGACNLDHHGECLTHGLPDSPCPHPLGRQFVEAWRAVAVEQQPEDGDRD